MLTSNSGGLLNFKNRGYAPSVKHDTIIHTVPAPLLRRECSPREECDELSVIALEEQHGSRHMYLKEGDKFISMCCHI